MTKTLKEFLKKHNACEDGYKFAKDLTLEEFLKKCERGDWILWLFAKMHPEKIRELTLAKGKCAETVKHLMKDERSKKAVEIAIAFGENRATKKELDDAAFAAAADAAFAAAASAAAASASAAAFTAADAASDAAAASASDYSVAKKQNQKQTADICRKYLPIEIWNREEM